MTPGAKHVRVLIVGSGFSGLAASIKLAERGVEHIVVERRADVGGTWYDNTYPGCRCDVPSPLYSFSFAPNPNWSELYSPQPEIQAYLRATAERFNVLPRIRFGVTMLDASWEDAARHWAVQTSAGPITCEVLILGTGPLSEPKYPEIEGLDAFDGPVLHSARWDPGVELDGKRVAVVGTGASAIQIVPHVQRQASQLHLFQRTPAWVLPHPNRPISAQERALFRRVPLAQKAVRGGIYTLAEGAAIALTRRPRLTRALRRVALAHLHRQVKDPEKRRQLTPTYLPGCKRLLPSDDFYPAVAQPNVQIVTSGIARVDGKDIVTADGNRHTVDAIILGTGFHVTDNPMMDDVRGRVGASLAKVWAEYGMGAYLGSTVPGFPNMFFLAGPNTGIGHTSLVVMIEAQVRYLLGCLDELDRRGANSFEVRPDAYAAYNAELQQRMARTVWTTGGCASWYLDDKGRNPTLWPDFTFNFIRRTRRFDSGSYEFRAA
jgi:cation diffusion facilitator CzcD-associated flavoprotein CzcO